MDKICVKNHHTKLFLHLTSAIIVTSFSPLRNNVFRQSWQHCLKTNLLFTQHNVFSMYKCNLKVVVILDNATLTNQIKQSRKIFHIFQRFSKGFCKKGQTSTKTGLLCTTTAIFNFLCLCCISFENCLQSKGFLGKRPLCVFLVRNNGNAFFF